MKKMKFVGPVSLPAGSEEAALELALMRWQAYLTPGGYPATAIIELLKCLRAGPHRFYQADRELAVTALDKYGPHDTLLQQRLEADHVRASTAPRGDGSHARA